MDQKRSFIRDYLLDKYDFKSLCAASVHQPSLRPYPNKIAEPVYGADMTTRKVAVNGVLRWKSYEYVTISRALTGKYIGVKPLDNRIYEIYYRQECLGYFQEGERVERGRYYLLNSERHLPKRYRGQRKRVYLGILNGVKYVSCTVSTLCVLLPCTTHRPKSKFFTNYYDLVIGKLQFSQKCCMFATVMDNNTSFTYDKATSLGQLSGSIFNLLKKELQLQFKKRNIPLKVEYFPVVNKLLDEDRVSQQTIAKWFGYDRPRTSRIVDYLEASGFVTREDDPESRRTKLVCLSNYTKQHRNLIILALEASFETAYKGMSKEEISNSIKSMQKIKINLSK